MLDEGKNIKITIFLSPQKRTYDETNFYLPTFLYFLLYFFFWKKRNSHLNNKKKVLYYSMKASSFPTVLKEKLICDGMFVINSKKTV